MNHDPIIFACGGNGAANDSLEARSIGTVSDGASDISQQSGSGISTAGRGVGGGIAGDSFGDISPESDSGLSAAGRGVGGGIAGDSFGADALAARIRDALCECFDLAAKTAETVGSARQGDAKKQEAERLVGAFVDTLTAVREDLRAAVEALPKGDVHPEAHSYFDRAYADCMEERLRIAMEMEEHEPGLLRYVAELRGEAEDADANEDQDMEMVVVD